MHDESNITFNKNQENHDYNRAKDSNSKRKKSLKKYVKTGVDKNRNLP